MKKVKHENLKGEVKWMVEEKQPLPPTEWEVRGYDEIKPEFVQKDYYVECPF